MGAKGLAGFLALAAVAGTAADGQQLVGGPAPSTGVDLKSRAQRIIDAANAGPYFEALSDTRFLAVRHARSGFTCTFMPFSHAGVYVLDGGEPSAGDDVICVELQGDATMEFRISRFADVTIDALFESALTNANRDFEDEAREIAGAAFLARSPASPQVELGMPRRQVLLVGQSEGQPAMQRLALAQLPGGWFVRQRYSVLLPTADDAQLEEWAIEGAELAEAIFALKLGELEAPAPDPALAIR